MFPEFLRKNRLWVVALLVPVAHLAIRFGWGFGVELGMYKLEEYAWMGDALGPLASFFAAAAFVVALQTKREQNRLFRQEEEQQRKRFEAERTAADKRAREQRTLQRTQFVADQRAQKKRFEAQQESLEEHHEALLALTRGEVVAHRRAAQVQAAILAAEPLQAFYEAAWLTSRALLELGNRAAVRRIISEDGELRLGDLQRDTLGLRIPNAPFYVGASGVVDSAYAVERSFVVNKNTLLRSLGLAIQGKGEETTLVQAREMLDEALSEFRTQALRELRRLHNEPLPPDDA